MKTPEIARQLARRSRVTQAEGADRLDRVVRTIVSDLRHGKESTLPGLGKFKKGIDGLRIPMMSISHSDLMPISSERSDAGLSQCEIVIGIRQEFCLFFVFRGGKSFGFGR
jgi:hypothetical protein